MCNGRDLNHLAEPSNKDIYDLSPVYEFFIVGKLLSFYQSFEY